MAHMGPSMAGNAKQQKTPITRLSGSSAACEIIDKSGYVGPAGVRTSRRVRQVYGQEPQDFKTLLIAVDSAV